MAACSVVILSRTIAVKIECPICKAEGDWFAGKYGPFCSRRCKLVDLGKWFSEEHLISRTLSHEDSDATDRSVARDPEPTDEA